MGLIFSKTCYHGYRFFFFLKPKLFPPQSLQVHEYCAIMHFRKMPKKEILKTHDKNHTVVQRPLVKSCRIFGHSIETICIFRNHYVEWNYQKQYILLNK